MGYKQQPYIVPIFAVDVCEGRVQDVRDGIVSRYIWAIGNLKRVQSNMDGGANVVLYKIYFTNVVLFCQRY